MFRYFRKDSVIAWVALCFTLPFAAEVSWQSSTNSAPWVDKGTLPTTAWDNDNGSTIIVNEQTTFQEYDGHGGCINEVGWKVLSMIQPGTRDSVIKLSIYAGCLLVQTITRSPGFRSMKIKAIMPWIKLLSIGTNSTIFPLLKRQWRYSRG
jgi:hypothetical protein